MRMKSPFASFGNSDQDFRRKADPGNRAEVTKKKLREIRGLSRKGPVPPIAGIQENAAAQLNRVGRRGQRRQCRRRLRLSTSIKTPPCQQSNTGRTLSLANGRVRPQAVFHQVGEFGAICK